VARYREKSPEDLAWNRIRRELTRALDTEIQNRREEALNKLLGGAWDEYVSALESGTVRELESKYQTFISGIVDDVVQDPDLPSESEVG
jgi:hypothetical protein